MGSAPRIFCYCQGVDTRAIVVPSTAGWTSLVKSPVSCAGYRGFKSHPRHHSPIRTMKKLLTLLTAVALAATSSCFVSCNSAPNAYEGPAVNPLNTPGDAGYIDYANADIHWRLFASDYGHR